MRLLFILFCLFNIHTAMAISADEIKSTMNAYMKKNSIPGAAVVVISNGKPSHYFFGVANKEKNTPITKDTIFELGSITKIFTSLLLAEQVDSAKLQLDDLLTDYVPNLSDSFDDVSLLNLATHTSGLSTNVPDTIKTPAELNSYLENYSSEEFADDHFQYSNVGMGLLGMALANQAHKSLNDLYIAQILKPLHMQPIGIVVPSSLANNIAQGYTPENQPALPVSDVILAGEGAAKASSEDMQKFLSAAIGLPGTPSSILYPMRLTQVSYLDLPDGEQGLGWSIHDVSAPVKPFNYFGKEAIVEKGDKAIYDGNKLIDKSGATDGFRAYIALIPNKKSGIVILANRSSTDTSIVTVGRKILLSAAGVA